MRMRFRGLHIAHWVDVGTGVAMVVLDTDAVQAPDKVLSEWVVASYRPEQAAASS